MYDLAVVNFTYMSDIFACSICNNKKLSCYEDDDNIPDISLATEDMPFYEVCTMVNDNWLIFIKPNCIHILSLAKSNEIYAYKLYKRS